MPSYGKYITPVKEGIHDLFSKPGGYLPGTHAYYVSAQGAQLLLNHSQTNPAPADLFLNKKGNNLNTLDLKSKNYFNTYRYKGLPPTPICYPGEKAILAVLYPNNTDYLYFVSDGKGGHRFSKNFSDHKKNIKLWIKGLKNYGKN